MTSSTWSRDRQWGIADSSFSIAAILLTLSVSACLTFFPKILFAQYGSISGKVYSYTQPYTALQGMTVAAFDSLNEQKGTATTNSKGNYTIQSLSPGFYKVCAKGEGYVTECYECSQPNCGYYWITDPNESNGTLVQVAANTTTPDINFYICHGGSIEGDVFGSVEGRSYQVLIDGNVQYKGKKAVFITDFSANIEDNHYFTTAAIPPGEFKVRVEDASLDYPYYHVIYYNGKYTREEAQSFVFLLDQQTHYTGKNFTLKMGGIIKGQVTEYYKGNYIGIPDAQVTVTEVNSGYQRFYHTREMYNDPNDGYVYIPGIFLITGLPPGSYIMQTEDVYIPDRESRIYLIEYYNNVYFREQATPISITSGQEREINVVLENAPVIKGWAMGEESSPCDPNQYVSNKALQGIRVEITPITAGESYMTATDPNGRYTFGSYFKIPPGTYNVKAKDPNFQYFSSAFKMITVAANGQYKKNFCLEKVPPGSGTGSISGNICLNEDMSLPLSNIWVRGINLNTIDFYDSNTISTGAYLLENLPAGEYVVLTSSNRNSSYNDLILELYKNVTLLDPNQFEEGKKIYQDIEQVATKVVLYPSEHITGIDIGLSSYKYTFESGLNLFGYPGSAVNKYNTSYEVCALLGTKMDDFRWKDPNTGIWYMTLPNASNPSQPSGANISVSTGKGFLIYMKNQAGPIFLPPYKIQPPASYRLVVGKNYLAYPSSLASPIKSSSDFMKAVGTNGDISNMQSFNNRTGKWKSTVWMWGRPGSGSFPLAQGSGYLVGMKAARVFTP